MATKSIPESEILAPRDPALDKDSDEWPEFELKDVRVYLQDDPTFATSLLEATVHYPLSLTGYLEPVAKEQADLLLQSVPRRAPLIEVSDVKTFSYGQFEDGNIGLWAGGKAGWFSLKPSRSYRPTWNSMVEDVKMMYWVADAYREKRRKGAYKTAALLPPYEPEELFQKYAEQVLESPEGAAEAAEKIYGHRCFLLSSMLSGKEGIAWAKNPLYAHLVRKFPEDHEEIKARLSGPPSSARTTRHTSVSSETSSLKRKRGRPAKHASADVVSLGSSSVAESASKEDAAAKPTKKIQPAPAKATASRKTRQGRTASASVPAESPGSDSGTPQTADSDDDSPSYALKGRSALRPKPTKAQKGSSRGGKAPAHDPDEDEDELASSPTGPKRRHSSKHERDTKHRTSRPDVDEGIDMPSSPSSSTHSSTSDTHTGASSSTSLALRTLNHVPDHLQEDTWICALDGCSHKVYQSSLPDSQRLIREHYALHAYDDDERVQMVKSLQHPSLPVNHLMERVRVQAKMEGFPGSRAGADLEGGANVHSRFPALPVVRY